MCVYLFFMHRILKKIFLKFMMLKICSLSFPYSGPFHFSKYKSYNVRCWIMTIKGIVIEMSCIYTRQWLPIISLAQNSSMFLLSYCLLYRVCQQAGFFFFCIFLFLFSQYPFNVKKKKKSQYHRNNKKQIKSRCKIFFKIHSIFSR